MMHLVATISVAALSVVQAGIVTSGAVPAVTFHRDNHAKRAAMGYAAASARLRRAVLEAKSAAWDEEEVGWDNEDQEWAQKAQTSARELLAYVEKVSDQKSSESSTGSLRGTSAMQNHTEIEHPVYQVGNFGLKSKFLEVATPDSDDDDSTTDEPHPYVHYKKIVSMVKDARNEIKAAKWDEEHEEQVDSTARDEGKKVLFAAGKLVSVLAQVVSWAKAHQATENATEQNTKKSSTPTVSKAAPPRALAAHSNSSTKVVTVNATVNATKNSTITPKVKAAVSNKTNPSVSNKTSTVVSNKTSPAVTTTTTTTTAPKASADIENEATRQAEVVEVSSKKIAAAVKELDDATNDIRKDDPSVEDVMSELDKATGKLENATTRISLKIIAHRLVQESRKKAKDEVPKVEKPAENASTAKNATSAAQEAPVVVAKANATAPAPKVNATEATPEAPKHEVKVTANASVPQSLVKQVTPVKQKSPEEQMDELLNAEGYKLSTEAEKTEAADETQEQQEAKAQATREKQEAEELKKEESEIEREQDIEAQKEADEKKAEADQLEAEEKDADEELTAEREERKAKALMRLAKKRRAKLSKPKAKSQKADDSAELGF